MKYLNIYTNIILDIPLENSLKLMRLLQWKNCNLIILNQGNLIALNHISLLNINIQQENFSEN